MKSSVRLAGAVTLCAALLLTGCAKKSTETTSADSSTTTAQTATAAPAGAGTVSATSAPVATATTGTMTVTTNGSTNGAASGDIELPVYPGATELKDQSLSASSGGTSVTMKVYSSKDDTKRVADWYKAHLPARFQDHILTAGGKTVGTFADEHKDGDQSVIVSNQDDGTTRIQLATKHGK